MKTFTVKVYYSSFNNIEVVAKDENEAIAKARNLPFKNQEILSNLEAWHEADEIEVTQND